MWRNPPRTTWLFNYGSNHPGQLADRVGIEKTVHCCVLFGYKRVFRGWSHNWGGGVASLEPDPDGMTFGYATRMTAAELRVLDRYEGVRSGNYRRLRVRITLSDGERDVNAIAYVSNSDEYNAPTRAYLKAIARTVSTCWSGSDGAVTWQDFPLR